MFPAPVAATTIPTEPRATAASRIDGSSRDRRRHDVDRLGRAGDRQHRAARSAFSSDDDPSRLDPAEPADVQAAERVERRGVGLRDVVGGLDRPGEDDHHPRSGELLRAGRRDRIAQVVRAVVVGLRRIAHRAGHDDRLGRIDDQIEEEARLLDRVGPLDEDDTVDLGVGREVADPPRDLGQVQERPVAGRLAAVVDRDEVGDPVEAGGPGEDRRSVEGGDRAAGLRIDEHADRAPGEHDRDPLQPDHSWGSPPTWAIFSYPTAPRRVASRHIAAGIAASQTPLNRPTRSARRARSAGGNGPPSGPVSQRSES